MAGPQHPIWLHQSQIRDTAREVLGFLNSSPPILKDLSLTSFLKFGWRLFSFPSSERASIMTWAGVTLLGIVYYLSLSIISFHDLSPCEKYCVDFFFFLSLP